MRTAAATRKHPAALLPVDQATTVTSVVTATVGPGWLAIARPFSVRARLLPAGAVPLALVTEATMPR
ncbi:hypothetical protein GCM10009744_36040 [Kribbella alba]|uniref:Uncharacterized protein n=1 Tax=Kribbella alba TaxID=190197 RepID=A0ABP4RBB9_9ACTN